MIATIICILILTIWLSLSVTLFVRRKISAKKNGTPACCCGCSGCSEKSKCSSKM
ncbi:FeoB-associated Cys-rich membrane protein [Treponema peruense]|uniref:FeoB-associated Cys-rich membrane protein n=1 Tax=Treponema peruense TaxID=2787628 RepID=A0A7T3RDT0_9SPIR|nr:FeoB-associated Cys-rich membrane protein [Treponema peruense]